MPPMYKTPGSSTIRPRNVLLHTVLHVYLPNIDATFIIEYYSGFLIVCMAFQAKQWWSWFYNYSNHVILNLVILGLCLQSERLKLYW